MSTTQTDVPQTTTLALRAGAGYVTHTVSTAPPRECTRDEIPLIDLAAVDGSDEERRVIANNVRHAAENSGFFYIVNHGVDNKIIQKAHDQAVR